MMQTAPINLRALPEEQRTLIDKAARLMGTITEPQPLEPEHQLIQFSCEEAGYYFTNINRCPTGWH